MMRAVERHDDPPADLARVIGILDWEMSTLGDPLMDLGTSLCYWVEAADPPLDHDSNRKVSMENSLPCS